jgi:anaerobic selenocysteine-containing dehydrogenase
MDVSRRTFLKTTVAGGVGLSVFGFDLAPVYAQTQGLKIERTTETRSICPYCSVMKKQYSRYTPEMVERITGIPKDQFLKAADLFTSIRKDGF